MGKSPHIGRRLSNRGISDWYIVLYNANKLPENMTVKRRWLFETGSTVIYSFPHLDASEFSIYTGSTWLLSVLLIFEPHANMFSRSFLRVATSQGKQGIWVLLFPDRENTGNFVVTQGKFLRHRENIFDCIH